jgi:hypothetical protein
VVGRLLVQKTGEVGRCARFHSRPIAPSLVGVVGRPLVQRIVEDETGA